MAQVTILVGTMTGTAELVAEDVAAALGDADHEVEVVPMDDLGLDVFQRGGVFLVCTSTYGQGDIPDNGQAFFDALKAQKPDLGHVIYGVIGLGDRTYADTFCFGGRRFDELLASLGARSAMARLDHDASGADLPEDAGVAWAEEWIEQVAATA
jgi:MioC protein